MPERPISFPDSASDRDTLRRRAIRLASENNRTRTAPAGELFLTVRLGARELYGIPYAGLEEIVRPRGLTPIPRAPAFVAGVLSRRGRLIAILSLRHLLPMDGREDGGEDTRIVVVRSDTLTVGLLVDGVEGNAHWDPDQLAPAPPSPGVRDQAWIAGIHEGRVAILDTDRLLAAISLEDMQ